MKHEPHICTKCPYLEYQCPYCDGGLFTCINCGASEGELTTDCPGYDLITIVRDLVYKGYIDFVNNEWIILK